MIHAHTVGGGTDTTGTVTTLMGRRLALAAWTLLILTAVVPWRNYTDHVHWSWVQWIPFATPPVKARDIIANTLMYIPLGYLYARERAGRGHEWRIVAYAAVLSLATEATQLFSHTRFPSTGDWVCNVTGAWLGTKLAMTLAAKRATKLVVKGERAASDRH
jgi:glycopeptide antibiotics resistance protein